MASIFDPFREIDRVVQAVRPGNSPEKMPMDLYRDGDRYLLEADLPGIDPDSVDLDLDGQLLTVRAERRIAEAGDVQWITRERRDGSFVRQLNLGQGVDVENISARYDRGVLTVTIPVRESAKPRKISVTTGAPETVKAAEPVAEPVADSETVAPAAE
ncbi:MAG: Hsp20/alpha crystallin family protein [Galactobacter sp.]